jgi:uncharacterized membrane protein
VFAVIITIMVLQLKLPAHPTLAALFDEWPTALSYIVSYVLIAIMWINHHFLLGFAKSLTPRVILWNFFHMFCASLVPFATAWMAATRFASAPVFTYAATIVLVNLSYHAFAVEVVPGAEVSDEQRALRRTALSRSYLTLGLFSFAMVLALWFPLVAFAIVTCVLLTYARPEIPGAQSREN